MGIEELHADDYGGDEKIRKRSPHWQDIEYAIRRLDGCRFTQVGLFDTYQTGLIIAGGYGRYLCERMQLEDNYRLLDPTKGEAPGLQIERDGDEYPGNWTVDLEMTLKAARTFFETGLLDSSMQWHGPRLA